MRPSRRPALLLVILSAALPAQGASQLPVELTGGRTEIRLNVHLLTDVGISIRGAAAVAGPIEGQESIATEFSILESSVLELALPSGSYRGPVSGYLAHEGGFDLEWPGGHVSLIGFELHPGLPPNAFELRGKSGRTVFVLDNPHPQPNGDGSEFLFLDMDLRLSAQLAERLGRFELGGLAVGEAHVRAGVLVSDQVPTGGPAAGATGGGGETCVPDYNGPVDILLESMSSVSESFHDSQRVAMAPAVRLQNVGTADVKWFRSIAPDGNPPLNVVGQHPFLVMHLSRLANGRIEQIGRSDVKHAFFSANTPPCDCQPDQVLFNDCTDLYGAATNARRDFLAPRDEVTASTGAWTRTGSHFDGPPPDDGRGHGLGDHPDSFEHRLSAPVVDLETPGAEYRVEAWYLVQEDINIFNSMGHRVVVPTPPTPSMPPDPEDPWTFPFDDTALTLGSVLDTWVDPLSPPPGAANVTITTLVTEDDWDGVEVDVETELKLAVIASTPPTGLTHYEYALMNFDFDRRIDSFMVPLPPGATVWNAWFGDQDGLPGNDWTAAVGASYVTWQAPAGNALDWGTMFNFAFDTNAEAGNLPITLGVFEPGEPGSPMVLAATAVGPATLTPISAIEVSLSGAGGGQVTSLPAGIDCAVDCDEIFADGIAIELSATATAGSAFIRWEENAAIESLDLALGFAAAGDRDLTAVFDICQADVVLGPQTVGSPTVFCSCESITAGSGFVVASEVVFRAGRLIALGDGFTVGAGGHFSAELAPEQSTLPPG